MTVGKNSPPSFAEASKGRRACFGVRRLSRSFFDRPTLQVARELLGMYLVRREGAKLLCGRIVETEAYVGPEDKASHASRGRTVRNAVMFGPPGFTYVYQIYGMYYCLNLVTERESYPAAVLIRALDNIRGIEELANGPGKLCRALRVDRRLNGVDLEGKVLWVEDPGGSKGKILAASRVGVEYAGAWARKPWRFYLAGSPAISRPLSRTQRRK